MKWMECDFLAMKKFCPWLKTHFPSISQAGMYFFCPDKKYFVQADGLGIKVTHNYLIL